MLISKELHSAHTVPYSQSFCAFFGEVQLCTGEVAQPSGFVLLRKFTAETVFTVVRSFTFLSELYNSSIEQRYSDA